MGSPIEHHYKNYEDWPCIKCGRSIRFLKPLHGVPEVVCEKCKKENENAIRITRKKTSVRSNCR